MAGRGLICEDTGVTASWWTAIDSRTLEPTRKDTLCPKTKKSQRDGRRDASTIKSNLMPARWATHHMENNDTEKFSRCWEDSEPHVRLPGLRV